MTLSKMAKQYMKDRIDEMYKSACKGEQVKAYNIMIALKEAIDDE